MSVPRAYPTAQRCAVVLFLHFHRDEEGHWGPMALMGTYIRDEDQWAARRTGREPDSHPTRSPRPSRCGTWMGRPSPSAGVPARDSPPSPFQVIAFDQDGTILATLEETVPPG